MTQRLFSIAFAIVVTYAGMFFINGNPNVFEWSVGMRIVSLIITYCVYLSTMEQWHKKMKDEGGE